MILRTLLLTALAISATGAALPVTHPAQAAVCPAASAAQVAYVQSFFAPATLSFREHYGLQGISPGDVRALTDPLDAETCRRMANAVTLPQTHPYPKVWRGFRAGAYYVMLVTLEVPDGVYYPAGGEGMIVLDANMGVVVTVS